MPRRGGSHAPTLIELKSVHDSTEGQSLASLRRTELATNKNYIAPHRRRLTGTDCADKMVGVAAMSVLYELQAQSSYPHEAMPQCQSGLTIGPLQTRVCAARSFASHERSASSADHPLFENTVLRYSTNCLLILLNISAKNVKRCGSLVTRFAFTSKTPCHVTSHPKVRSFSLLRDCTRLTRV